ncbi:MAG: radical SAM protein [Acidobacteriota bacterium]
MPQIHLFQAGGEPQLLVADGTRIYGVDSEIFDQLEEASLLGNAAEVDRLLQRFGLDAAPFVSDEPPESFPIRALSLAVAQKCNLGCTYCYAQEGAFGGAARNMPLETARRSVRRLFEEAAPGERVQLAFLGGEPLVNRPVLRDATQYAEGLSRETGVEAGFSITTNGTLVRPEDGEFFERHGFAVTVSLDGLGEAHDRLRPFKGGRGSFEHILRRIRPLLEMQRRMQVSARVTVTPRNLELRRTLDGLIELGFHSVGFSPMLSSPTGRGEMQPDDLQAMLAQMIDCASECERRTAAGERYPFANLLTALKEIHRGTHRPYPCGAGGGYFGVSAEGGLFACHRFVDDQSGAMGNLEDGLDRQRQSEWLAERHVHRQEPCRSCWARYLCGGGCHHEVIHRGRPACDYIRGWLDHCLKAYVRLLDRRPDFFSSQRPSPLFSAPSAVNSP